MIPNNNLFTGAFGKSQHIEASKCFTTPHSINVPVQYSINTNLIGEFVASSLDGRLWCLKRSTRYTFFSLKWNPDSLQLDFAASLARSGETFLARGLDWILTDKSFVRVLDDEPFIIAVSLPTVLSLHDTLSIHDCFSVLPAVGNFQIVNNLLFRRDDNGKCFTLITPLEFHQNFSVDAQALINQEVALSSCRYHVIAHNGALWGRGQFSFGQVFLLPAVFNLDGSVLSYYLYFQNCSSEFNLSRFSDDNSIAPAFFGDNLYGFFYDHHQNLCSVSKDNNIFNLNSTAWEKLSDDNGFIFADPFASRGLLLDSNGVTILHELNSRLDCKTLPQWVAPAGNIDALDANLFVASDDSSTFVTLPDSGLSREVLFNKILPLSAPSHSSYRFSLGLSTSNNRNVLDVNQFLSQSKIMQPILWDYVYKHALDLQFLNVLHDVPFFHSIFCDDNLYDAEISFVYPVSYFWNPLFTDNKVSCSFLSSYYNYSLEHISVAPFSSLNGSYYGNADVPIAAEAHCYYLDTDSASIVDLGILHADFEFLLMPHYFNGDVDFTPKHFFSPINVSIFNGKIGFVCGDNTCDDDGHQLSYNPIFVPLIDVPESLGSFCIHVDPMAYKFNLYREGVQGVFLDDFLLHDDAHYAIFHEASSNTKFALSCPFNPGDNLQFGSFSDSASYSINSEGKKKFLHNFHVIGVPSRYDYDSKIQYYDFYIFRSTLRNDIFNFDSELERSYRS